MTDHERNWDLDRPNLGKWGTVPVETAAGNRAEQKHLDLFDAYAATMGPGYMAPKGAYRRG